MRNAFGRECATHLDFFQTASPRQHLRLNSSRCLTSANHLQPSSTAQPSSNTGHSFFLVASSPSRAFLLPQIVRDVRPLFTLPSCHFCPSSLVELIHVRGVLADPQGLQEPLLGGRRVLLLPCGGLRRGRRRCLFRLGRGPCPPQPALLFPLTSFFQPFSDLSPMLEISKMSFISTIANKYVTRHGT